MYKDTKMKKLFLGLTLSMSFLAVANANECSYTYQAEEITIFRNYDSVYGNYDWENEIIVIAKNSTGEEIEDTASLGWVHNENNYASSWAKTPQTKNFLSSSHKLPLSIKNGKIEIKLRVEEVNPIRNNKIININYSFDVKDLPWTKYEEINQSGTKFRFMIKKDCN